MDDPIGSFTFAVKEALLLLKFPQKQQDQYVNRILGSVLTKTFTDQIGLLTKEQKTAFRNQLASGKPEDLSKIISETFNIQDYKGAMKKDFSDMYDKFIATVSKEASKEQRITLEKMHKAFKAYFQ